MENDNAVKPIILLVSLLWKQNWIHQIFPPFGLSWDGKKAKSEDEAECEILVFSCLVNRTPEIHSYEEAEGTEGRT